MTEIRPNNHRDGQPRYSPAPPLEPGTLIGGRYRITGPIGAGGFGEIYAATDTKLPGQVPCVVKRLTPNPSQYISHRQQVVEQLKAEAHVLEALHGGGAHARIPDLYQVFPDDLCLVMTAIKGVDLDQVLTKESEALTEAYIVKMLEDVCTSLVFLHSRQMPFVHQDIKPKNLVRDPKGNTWLTDFGITESLATILNWEHHSIAGTDGYTPPEQARGESEEGSDVYALAMTAAVLLNRQTPQQLDREAQLARLRQQRPRIAAELIRLIAAGLTLEVQKRPTANQMLKRVRRLRAKLAPDGPMQPEIRQINTFLRAGQYREAAQVVQSEGATFSKEQRTAVADSIKQVIVQPIDDPLALARLYAALADLHWRNQDPSTAAEYCIQGLKIIVSESDTAYERALLLNRLGTAYSDLSFYDQAHEMLTEALKWCGMLDDPKLESQIYHNMGKVAYANNQSEAAFQAYSTSLHLREQTSDLIGIVETLSNFGLIAIKLGKAEIARKYYQYCRDVSKQMPRSDMVAVALANFGGLARDYGEWSQAQTAFFEAHELFERLSQPLYQALCLYNLGDIALEAGDSKTALRYSRQALALASKPEGQQYAACAWRVIGKALLLEGELQEAAHALDQAWHLVQTGEPYDQAFVLEALATMAYRQQDWALAQRHCAEARTLAEDEHIPILITSIERLLHSLTDKQS